MAMKKPLHTLIVKTVGSRCNLRCDYCFYLNKEWKYEDERVMDDATLEVLIMQMMAQTGNSFGIVWQGGEPTLAGSAFFQKAISWMLLHGKGKNKVISNIIQTNGYAMNNGLAELLARYRFLVGLSLDGPEDIHDRYRKTPSGKGSYREVMKSWENLQRKEVATNILACVTPLSASQPERLYQFFRQHRMDWLQFIPVYENDSTGIPASYALKEEAWGVFMCRIFDLWHTDLEKGAAPPSIRFIENALHSHLGLESPECTYQETCGKYLVVEHQGDVFSCDYLVGKNTLLGNIRSENLFAMLNSQQQRSFGQIKQLVHAGCTHCPWLAYCHNGCPKYRDASGKYRFCSSWKMFLEHSNSRLTTLADLYRINNPGYKNDTMDVSGLLV
jgi:uncharacterized protein